ncbi:hypothetical protein L6R52_07740 [Myxococcota bacterium]|nr:hypothetical protein [Myxococcota bacterium]
MTAPRLTELHTRAELRDLCITGRRVLTECTSCHGEHEHLILHARAVGAATVELRLVPIAPGDSPRFYCGAERTLRVGGDSCSTCPPAGA